jgi:hypothetical protein
VPAVKEVELLLTMGRIVGGIDVQKDLPPLADLLATETDE